MTLGEATTVTYRIEPKRKVSKGDELEFGATAVVEAGCKVTVGGRLKRAGMHWTVGGANAILALRCTVLSGRFDAFWNRRARESRAA